jgi:serine/threonine-protein kinase HipA
MDDNFFRMAQEWNPENWNIVKTSNLDRKKTLGLMRPEQIHFFSKVDYMNNDRATPRMSGVQVKIPTYLDDNGVLSPAINKPFTHILKMPYVGQYESIGAIEWYSLSLARFAGIKTEEFALADIENIGPALIAERFDVGESKDDKSWYMTEDFCSALNLSRVEKFDVDLIDVGRVLMKNTFNRAEDADQFFRQVVFSWLIANSDVHAKNMMLIKKSDGYDKAFNDVRLSPAYDIISAAPYNITKKMTVKISGKTDFGLDDFLMLAKSVKIDNPRAKEIIRDVIQGTINGMAEINARMPELISKYDTCVKHIRYVGYMINSRKEALEAEMAAPQRSTRMTFG